MASLSHSRTPADYFKDIRGFPMLRLPRWLAESTDANEDVDFQDGLAYSTVSGYYFVRLIDNLMDNQATNEKAILSISALFHTEFQRIYQEYFAATHPFWEIYRREWARGFDSAAAEASATDIDEDRFYQLSATKTCAGKIPLAATAFHFSAEDRLPEWNNFCDALSAWIQMRDDMSDWYRDHRCGAKTFFLSRSNANRLPDETLLAWLGREGASWGTEQLQGMHQKVRKAGAPLNSQSLDRYVDELESWMVTWTSNFGRAIAELAKVAKALA